MYLFCVVLEVLFGARYLIVSWFITEQGYMLDVLGDVTSLLVPVNLQGVSVTQ